MTHLKKRLTMYKDCFKYTQLANCKERLFMMPTTWMFLHPELDPKRFEANGSNNAIRIRWNVQVLSTLKEKSIVYRMRTWQWRHVDSTVYTLQNSSLHSVWSILEIERSMVNRNALYLCAWYTLYCSRVSYFWLGK